MKKIVFLLLTALCLPLGLMAQSINDDLYFVPSKDKQENKGTSAKKEQNKQVKNSTYTAPRSTVVIRDRKGKTRDVDEYNRRYDARDNDFAMENDTLYIKEKSRRALDGEWVSGEFNGSDDDYEYAERIIRFRNPRFAISISSPLYWDVVYGVNSWDWNVYTDGLYAYAFPTFSNPLWWDWRYNSLGWGWNRPYYSSWGYYPGYWGGCYSGYWGGYGGGYGGGYWGHNYWDGPSWGGGSHYRHNNYTYRTSIGRSGDRGSYSSVRRSSSADRYNNQSVRSYGDNYRSSSSVRRVVGSRSSERDGTTTRTDASSRRSTYTRPSSTRYYNEPVRDVNSNAGSSRSSNMRSSSSDRSSTYSRGSSNSSSSERSSSSRSYSSPERSSSRSSSPSYSGSSSSSRSYSTGGGSGSSYRSSSGGGGSSRNSGRR